MYGYAYEGYGLWTVSAHIEIYDVNKSHKDEWDTGDTDTHGLHENHSSAINQIENTRNVIPLYYAVICALIDIQYDLHGCYCNHTHPISHSYIEYYWQIQFD